MSCFITSDNVKIVYTDHGCGIPVVFCHGYGIMGAAWISQEKTLLKAGYRVICYDRRSHGASDRPDYGHTMQRHGEDLYELLEALSLDRVILVGNSQGASTIWALIKKYGDDRLIGAVSMDQTPKMINDDGWELGMYRMTAKTVDTYFDTPLPNPMVHMPNIFLFFKLNKLMKRYPEFSEEATRQLLLDHARADWRDTISNVRIPVLFMAGRKSPFWPCEHAAASAKLCKNGEAVIIENSGHIVNWEQAKTCNKLLIKFIDKLVKG
jgi:pimeloyl-ACP methyl ester carboxylesterase